MPRKPAKSLQEQIYEARLRVRELEEQYASQLFFETMPEYGPMYRYSYDESCRTITYEMQSVDAWVRAIIKHMSLRRPGHGGKQSNAMVISIPHLPSDKAVDNWLAYESGRLRKKAARLKKKVT